MIRRISLITLLVILGLMTVGWFVIWRSPTLYTEYHPVTFPVPVLTMEQYGQVISRPPRPYVVSITHAESGGKLVLFGAEHTIGPGARNAVNATRASIRTRM